MLSGQKPLVTLLGAFVCGLGLPRWFLSFKRGRREKAFTNEFANASISSCAASSRGCRPMRR